MKNDIHPTTYAATVTCACGKTFVTLSTKESIQTEICSSCHPFFTGKQKLLDSARRVEKFQEKKEKQATMATSRAHLSKTAKHAARKEKKTVSKSAKADAKAALKDALSALKG